MKKVLIFLLPIFLAIIVFFIGTYYFSAKDLGTGGLQVTSSPQSQVYLNGKMIGLTPFCKCQGKETIATGDYTIRLVPMGKSLNETPFEQKITINKSVITAVDFNFGSVSKSQGSIISLFQLNNKQADLFITSFPDGATVTLDSGEAKKTPAVWKNVTDSEHKIILSKVGYDTKNLSILATRGYQLQVVVFLATNLSPSPSVSIAPSVSISPTASSSAKIIILDTPTGFLRVRRDATAGSEEIGQVLPNQTFALNDEKNGWYEITIPNGKIGWVSSTYAKKQ